MVCLSKYICLFSFVSFTLFLCLSFSLPCNSLLEPFFAALAAHWHFLRHFQVIVEMNNEFGECCLTNPEDPSAPAKSFTFDGAYYIDSTTEQIYNEIVFPLVEVGRIYILSCLLTFSCPCQWSSLPPFPFLRPLIRY